MKENSKTYVLDTNVLINDPDVIYKLGANEIVIPTAVIKEIDGLKRHPDPDEPKAKAARKVTRTMDVLGSSQDISRGARTSTGSSVRICHKYAGIDDLASNADNRIVGTAIQLKKETQGRVILISRDGNVRNVARAYGIKAENYPFYMGAPDMPKERVPQHRSPVQNYNENARSHQIRRQATMMWLPNRTRIITLAVIIVFFILLVTK